MQSWLRDSRHSLVVAMVLAGAVATAALSPAHYRIQLQEDGPVEWATFFSFVLACALGVRTLASTRGRTLERLALLGLALFCLFVAGEEISWGQRVFGFKPPSLFLEHNYQQETNLHNFLKTILDTRWVVLFIALSYGAALPLLAKRWPMLAPLSPSIGLAPAFLIVAALEGFYPLELAGELAELLLGLCFIVDMALRSGLDRDSATWALQGAALILGVVGTPIIERLSFGEAQETTAACRSELEQLERDLSKPQQLTDKLRGRGRVHKRLFTAVRSRYLRLGANSAFLEGAITAAESRLVTARRDRKGFLLDPWNQPYWMLYAKDRDGTPRLLLYSFGPNRRRDSVLEPVPEGGLAGILAGDDLGVLIGASE